MKRSRRENAVSSVAEPGKKSVFRKRALWMTALSLAGHFLYALYQGVLGVLQASGWFGALCAFYSLLAVLRLCAALWAARAVPVRPSQSLFRVAAVLLLLCSMMLAGVNALGVSRNLATAYGTIPMITIATYTFGKGGAVVVRAVRQHGSFSAQAVLLRNIGYAEVAASMLTLQRSMLASFGEMEKTTIQSMNVIAGAGLSLFILLLGVSMLLQSGKENALWQNQNW